MNYKTVNKSICICICALTFSFFSNAQMITNTSVTALQLAQALVGPGATVLNPVISGATGSYGTFSNGGSTNIGIDHGIILTSGTATFPSINTSAGNGIDNGYSGDPILDPLVGTPNFNFNACRFEFDVVAYDSLLTFNYVFASEEYNDYVGASVNDVFGFFISGPGIAGQQNIALIPGTSTNIAINNVNCGLNSSYYVCNDPWNQTSGGCSTQCPNSAAQTTIEYDGFTVLLTAQANVMACDTYHLILIIADVGDGVFDSGVMISNLLAGTVVYQNVSNPIPNYPTNTIVEGCTTGDVQVKKISNSGPCGIIDTSSTCSIDTICYHIVTSGNAIEGIDYISLPDTVCISVADSIFHLNIIPIADGIFEPPYDTIIIDLYPILDSLDTVNCSGAASLIPLHAMFLLMDPFVQTIPDDTICHSASISLSTTSNLLDYFWYPSSGLTCTNCLSPVASPTITTQYFLHALFGTCDLTDTVLITVNNVPIVDAGVNGSICPGGVYNINASNATTYVWLGTSVASLSDPNISNPVATPAATTTYTVQGSSNICGVTTDTVIVTVNPLPNAKAWPDSSVCPNQSVQLFSSGGVNYLWTGYFLNNDSIQNPIATPTVQTVVYTVTVTNQFDCEDTAQVTLHLFDLPVANAGSDVSIYLYDSIQLSGTGGSIYSWSPPTGLSDPNYSAPWASPSYTTIYVLTIISQDGCVDYDTVIVNVSDEPLVLIPNAISPNNDGHNDFLRIIYYGVFDLTYIKIYNRWGQLVFEGHNLSDWWDGKFNGEPCEVGVYTYDMEGIGYGTRKMKRQGNITLLR